MSIIGNHDDTHRPDGWVIVYRLLLTALMGIGLILLCHMPLTLVEGAVTLGLYLVLLSCLHNIYLACNVGQARVLELTLSQTLSNLVAIFVCGVCIALYQHRMLPLWPMVGVFIAQEMVSIAWTIVYNRAFFRHYRAPRTAIIYADEAMLQQLYLSPFFERKYDVVKRIRIGSMDTNALLKELNGYEAVFVADASANMANAIAKYCVETGVRGYFTPRLGHIVLSGAAYNPNFALPMLCVQRGGHNSGYLYVKRGLDVLVAVVGILLTCPIMLLTALAIFLEDHGPVFYRQTRLTRDGRQFAILKFRSMRVNAEQDGVARLAGQNDSRITRVGHFIRACRIDELPQLFNILAGDMSVVGPRPERPEIARQYQQEIPEFSLRLQVKAGLTGMAQVFGRYNTEPYHKLQMDLMYINEMSLIKDLYLILATVKTVFMKESTEGVQAGQVSASSRERQSN